MRGVEGDSERGAQPPKGCLRFGGLSLDLDSCTLTRESGEAIPLTRGEFALLRALAGRPGRVVSRETLLGTVSNRNVEPFDRSVDALISRLRRKIEADPKAPRLIVTVPGEGYRFDGLAKTFQLAPQPADAPPSLEKGTGVTTPTAFQIAGVPVLSRLAALVAALIVVFVAGGVCVWQAGLASNWMSRVSGDGVASAPWVSIVVLPFDNLSGDPEKDYVADGIADDLTTDLSRLPDSFVIARNTAFTYKGKSVNAKQIGRELGVRYIVQGSLQLIGETISVNGQLVSVETGAQLWADRFEGDRRDLGEFTVEFASGLANSLGIELIKAESLRALRERPDNPDSIDLAMRGEELLHSNRTRASFAEAMQFFQRALALDPQNARAMKDLAAALVMTKNNRWSDDPEGDIVRAGDLVDAALAMRRFDSEAHQIKGMVLAAQHKWGAAIAEAENAIVQNPNNARAYADIGFWSLFVGRSKDGFASIEKAFRLSPRDPATPTWHAMACFLHLSLAEWEQAINACNRSLAGQSSRWYSLVGLAVANAWMGHESAAKDALAELDKVYPGFTVQAWVREQLLDDSPSGQRWPMIAEGLRKAGLPEK
jgi:adenylate cyclase